MTLTISVPADSLALAIFSAFCGSSKALRISEQAAEKKVLVYDAAKSLIELTKMTVPLARSGSKRKMLSFI